jgi:regulatory protein
VPGAPPQTEEERRAQAVAWACAHVNRRERSVADVRAHLERRGVSEATAAAAIEELLETHLVDDERFATMFVADKRGLERWGTERIRRGLREHGIDRELAERVLAAGDPSDLGGPAGADAAGAQSETELDRALELLRRRFPEPPRDRRERDRALGVLLRKGYESELALDALAAHARAA